jgi:hypothetical protein
VDIYGDVLALLVRVFSDKSICETFYSSQPDIIKYVLHILDEEGAEDLLIVERCMGILIRFLAVQDIISESDGVEIVKRLMRFSSEVVGEPYPSLNMIIYIISGFINRNECIEKV